MKTLCITFLALLLGASFVSAVDSDLDAETRRTLNQLTSPASARIAPSRLKALVSNAKDGHLRTQLSVIYALQCLHEGQAAEAERVKTFLARQSAGAEELEFLQPKHTTEPCRTCSGSGSLAAAACRSCGGSGSCSACKGSGQRTLAAMGGGTRTVRCSKCAGKGRCADCGKGSRSAASCRTCGGQGSVLSPKQIRKALVYVAKKTLGLSEVHPDMGVSESDVIRRAARQPRTETASSLHADFQKQGYKVAPGGLMYYRNPESRHLYLVNLLNDDNTYLNLAIDARRHVLEKYNNWPLAKGEVMLVFSGVKIGSGQTRYREWLIGKLEEYLDWKKTTRAEQRGGRVSHKLGRYSPLAEDWEDCAPVELWCTSRNLESFGLGTSDVGGNVVGEKPHERRAELLLATLENLDFFARVYDPTSVVTRTSTSGEPDADQAKPGSSPVGHSTPAPGKFKQGDRVMIKWEGDWYPGAVLLARPNGKYHISYDGYGADWNEDVTAARLRRPGEKMPSASPAMRAVPGKRQALLERLKALEQQKRFDDMRDLLDETTCLPLDEKDDLLEETERKLSEYRRRQSANADAESKRTGEPIYGLMSSGGISRKTAEEVRRRMKLAEQNRRRDREQVANGTYRPPALVKDPRAGWAGPLPEGFQKRGDLTYLAGDDGAGNLTFGIRNPAPGAEEWDMLLHLSFHYADPNEDEGWPAGVPIIELSPLGAFASSDKDYIKWLRSCLDLYGRWKQSALERNTRTVSKTMQPFKREESGWKITMLGGPSHLGFFREPPGDPAKEFGLYVHGEGVDYTLTQRRFVFRESAQSKDFEVWRKTLESLDFFANRFAQHYEMRQRALGKQQRGSRPPRGR